MIIPPRLQPGDTIGIVTASTPLSQAPSPDPVADLKHGMALLNELGFEVILSQHALGDDGYSAASPEERANDINALFTDGRIKAIITSHGGWTANSCLPYIDWSELRRNPKIFMGFSDITILLNAIFAKTGVVTFHGHTAIFYLGLNPTSYDRQAILDRLVDGRLGAIRKNSEWRTIRGQALVEGRLFGGHVGQLSRLIGTPYMPDLQEAILFLEINGYVPADLYATFHQWKQVGLFDRIRGVLVGYNAGAPEAEGDQLERILARVTGEYDFPILKCDDFGHDCPNTVLPVGAWARLDAGRGELALLEPYAS